MIDRYITPDVKYTAIAAQLFFLAVDRLARASTYGARDAGRYPQVSDPELHLQLKSKRIQPRMSVP
jgi:hypothetical protein